ncbi:MAG: hypothetical protein AAFV29_02705, partial [Myxococcota bacterium]
MSAPTTDPIAQFEHIAYARTYEPALAALEALLKHLDLTMNGQYDGLFDSDERALVQATRLSGAICAMLADPVLKLTPEWYFRLIPFKRQLQALFELSGYQGSALPLRYMSDGVAQVASPLEEQSQLLKMLLVMGLSDCSESMFDVIKRLDSSVTAPLLLSLVTSKVVLEPSAWRARETILGSGGLFESAPLQEQHLGLLTAAWMQCSYAFRADRHDFKKALNDWLSTYLKRAGVAKNIKAVPRLRKERPRLV